MVSASITDGCGGELRHDRRQLGLAASAICGASSSSTRSAWVHGHHAGAWSPSQHVPHTTVPPSALTRLANRVSSAVLPMPASPVTRTKPAQPETVPAGAARAWYAAVSRASGSVRPTNASTPAFSRERRRSDKSASRFLAEATPALARTGYHPTHLWHPGDTVTVAFDPQQYKTTTRAQWEDAAEAWHRWGPVIEDWLGAATERMLDAAGITAGSRVLDVAAGAGGQSLAAARRVGPTGHVLATDISPAILEYAAKAAERRRPDHHRHPRTRRRTPRRR